MRFLIVSIGTLAWLACVSGPLSAGIVTHTNLASFSGAAGGTAAIVNFDSTALGTEILNNSSFGGITFQYGPNFQQETLRVTDGTITTPTPLSTTSGTRFLGTGVTGDQLAAGGANNFTMVFNVPARSVGLFVVLSSSQLGGGLFEGDFLLSAGGVSARLNPTPTPALPDGSQAFFLGLTEDTGLALGPVTLSSASPDTFGIRYRVDDIRSVAAVPEPSALAGSFWLLALVSPLARRSRRRVNC